MERPKNNRDFYTFIEAIGQSLEEAGQPAWAQRIRFAVRSGFTSGEIFSNLGNELDQLVASGVPNRSGLQAEVSLALELIDDALRRVGQIPPARP
jgi:hypothetical protein